MNIHSLEFRLYMEKRLNFVNDRDSYVRGFTIIYIIGDSLYIGHTINSIKVLIDDINDLLLWISYYDRI